MAINPYVAPNNKAPNSVELYDNLVELEMGKNLLKSLGDFWRYQFTDSKNIESILTGMTTLISQDYLDMLHSVLASNILNIPVDHQTAFSLVSFNSDKAVTVGTSHIEYSLKDIDVISSTLDMSSIRHIEFLLSGLFDPAVALEGATDSSKHFEIDTTAGIIKFYVDIFNDPNIVDTTYTVNSGNTKYVLLWATNTLVSERYIYDRFGVYLYPFDTNSLRYKLVLIALQYFFTKAKTVASLETTFNLLLGMPYSRKEGETVKSISAPYYEGTKQFIDVVTDITTYKVPAYLDLVVSVGEVLNTSQLIARFHRIYDYISNPTWYDNSRFPWSLVESSKYDVGDSSHLALRSNKNGSVAEQELHSVMDNVLKYNIVYAKSSVDFDNYTTYQDIATVEGALSSGIPAYLYLLIDADFSALLEDTAFSSIDDTHTLSLGVAPFDESTEKPHYANGAENADGLWNKDGLTPLLANAIRGGALFDVNDSLTLIDNNGNPL